MAEKMSTITFERGLTHQIMTEAWFGKSITTLDLKDKGAIDGVFDFDNIRIESIIDVDDNHLITATLETVSGYPYTPIMVPTDNIKHLGEVKLKYGHLLEFLIKFEFNNNIVLLHVYMDNREVYRSHFLTEHKN